MGCPRNQAQLVVLLMWGPGMTRLGACLPPFHSRGLPGCQLVRTAPSTGRRSHPNLVGTFGIGGRREFASTSYNEIASMSERFGRVDRSVVDIKSGLLGHLQVSPHRSANHCFNLQQSTRIYQLEVIMHSNSVLLASLACIASVSAHGHVDNIVSANVKYLGCEYL